MLLIIGHIVAMNELIQLVVFHMPFHGQRAKYFLVKDIHTVTH